MNKVTAVDVSSHALHIHRDLSVSPSIRKPGPAKRIDGMTMGVVTLTADSLPPHKGEVHPDGDELLARSPDQVNSCVLFPGTPSLI
jgi:hypothetical protein